MNLSRFVDALVITPQDLYFCDTLFMERKIFQQMKKLVFR